MKVRGLVPVWVSRLFVAAYVGGTIISLIVYGGTVYVIRGSCAFEQWWSERYWTFHAALDRVQPSTEGET